MTKYFLIISLLLSSLANAQIHVGSKEIPAMNSAGKISTETYSSYKKSITLFTLQYKDYAQKQAFENAIAKVWTVTPFQIIQPEELGTYLNKGGYSAFTFGGYVVQKQKGSTLHLTYDLNFYELNKKDKLKESQLARISLSSDFETYKKAMKYSGSLLNKSKNTLMSYIYNEAVFVNWNPGFLMGYLKEVNDLLVSEKERGPYTEETNKTMLTKLKTDTLYIPDYIFIKYNAFTGASSDPDEVDESDLFKAYPYPVKILPADKLNDLILNSESPVHYLVYAQSGTDKFLSVYENKTGKLLLNRYIKVSYNFKNKDLSRISKEIE